MPGPSNYRYEPFSDISSGVTLTERHLIPATSPYIVRLNEVPQKNSPSTMTVKEITDVNGETTSYGSTFDEVAANPSANQFWPDYNTGADGNDNWNTGLLQFNSADAGKLIEVSYTGTGTLASVQANRYPAWWLDRGDGSDGDFAPESNVTISGLKQYKSVFIKAGVTVSVTKVARICCQGAFVNNGTITAVGQGATGGAAGYFGGNGGASWYGGASGSIIPLTEETINMLVAMGQFSLGASGGGNDHQQGQGSGGGTIQIVTQAFENNGSIKADGGQAGSSHGNSGGGGGGGQVTVICQNNLATGTITANGGSRYPSDGGSNGQPGFTKLIELGAAI